MAWGGEFAVAGGGGGRGAFDAEGGGVEDIVKGEAHGEFVEGGVCGFHVVKRQGQGWDHGEIQRDGGLRCCCCWQEREWCCYCLQEAALLDLDPYRVVLLLERLGLALGVGDELPDARDVDLELLDVVCLSLAMLGLGLPDLGAAELVLVEGRAKVFPGVIRRIV